jgi:hypothetical protein
MPATASLTFYTVRPHGQPAPAHNIRSMYGLKSVRIGQINEYFWKLVNGRVNDAPELVSMLASGFQPEMIGGGCLAWRKILADESVIHIAYHEGDIGGDPDESVWTLCRWGRNPRQRFETRHETRTDMTLPEALRYAEALKLTYATPPQGSPTVHSASTIA